MKTVYKAIFMDFKICAVTYASRLNEPYIA